MPCSEGGKALGETSGELPVVPPLGWVSQVTDLLQPLFLLLKVPSGIS